MTTTKKPKKRDQKLKISAVEVLPTEKAIPVTAYTTALAKADGVIVSTGGACRGLIPTQRASHASAWQNLMTEDQATREQILQLKVKENEVLGLIRDLVAVNLLETMDAAITQGVLEAPEEV
jgi:hypothetical protein